MSLQYNVSQLLKSGIGEIREYEFQSDQPMDLEDGVATDIRGRVKFILTNYGIIADARAHARLHLTCARCLEPLTTTTEIAFEEEYQPSIDIGTGLPSKLPRTDTSFEISQSHTIDLGEAIRQNLVLTVDLIPICRQDCKGLCPTCGTNLNIQTCACPPAEQPSPFAVLAGLLAEEKKT
jgi:uncharacterized protein